MKSIDDLLRNDAVRWSEEQRSPLQSSGRAIMSKISGASRIHWISAIGAVSLATIALSLFVYLSPKTVVVQNAPTVQEATQTRTVQPQRRSGFAGDKRQAVITANTDGLPASNLRALSRVSTFEREVQRISRKAADARATDPLAAMLQYDGLARLCESHDEYSMAVTAWENAVELAALVGDSDHLVRMQRSLESARRK